MRNYVISIITLFSLVFLWPHLLLYFCSKSKDKIRQDIDRIKSKRRASFHGCLYVVYIILVDSYYRKLFYHRIGNISYLIKWYFPGNKTFYPMCDNIGGGVYLAHPCSTFLNAKSIGKNFTCRQNTTIGNKFEGENSKRPIIGDNVSLGANVCIIGDINIGNNVTVGAGTVVVKSVPDNAIVVGNPSRIIGFNE